MSKVGFLARLLGGRLPEVPTAQTAFVEREQMAPVSSAGAAQLILPFPVREPTALGQPDLVAATKEGAVSPAHAAVMFRYAETPYGRVTVMQQAGDRVATIRGGIQALIETSPDGGLLRWIENGVVFTVIAPTASREQLLEIAEKI
jgi:hypothetical protein